MARRFEQHGLSTDPGRGSGTLVLTSGAPPPCGRAARSGRARGEARPEFEHVALFPLPRRTHGSTRIGGE